MVISSEILKKIKDVIEKHYASLTIGILGKKALTQYERKKLTEQGIDIPEKDEGSILEHVYHHNYVNKKGNPEAPTSHPEMKDQQTALKDSLPQTPIHKASKEHLNETVAGLIEKHKTDIMTRVEGMIRERNTQFKFDSQQEFENMLKTESISQIKTKLRDLSKDANRNWDRVVNTEVSNAISLGSVDRIVDDNQDVDLGEVYVYRIVAGGGAASCRWCKRFYLDNDGTPKVYKMSTILANGSNYGLKTVDWKPVATATHPNEKCSGWLALKPGWAVQKGGTVTFIGAEKWRDYIQQKSLRIMDKHLYCKDCKNIMLHEDLGPDMRPDRRYQCEKCGKSRADKPKDRNTYLKQIYL